MPKPCWIAAAYSGYFSRLAEIALRGLEPGSLVCDAGCGLGDLSIHMAQAGMQVHAVDKSGRALARLREKSGNSAISICQADFFCRPPSAQPYDRMVFSLSASARDAFRVAREQRAKSLVVVNKMHGAPQLEELGEGIDDYSEADPPGMYATTGEPPRLAITDDLTMPQSHVDNGVTEAQCENCHEF